jgi:3-oxoadipate enol-lactonase
MTQAAAHETGFVEVDGGRLYYEVAGAGRPLVLIHAGVADSRMWDPQFAEFAQEYRVIRYDQRGFGQSSDWTVPFALHEDLRAVLDHVGVERAALLGCSMGGGVALSFALAYPARAAAVILAASGLGRGEASDYMKEQWAAIDAAEEDGDIPTAVDLEVRMWVDGPKRGPDQVDPQIRELVREMNTRTFTRTTTDIQPQRLDPPAEDRLGEIHIPTLLVVGDGDVPDVIATATWTAAEIAGARLVVLPEVAHMLNMEQPTEFNRIVLDFLSTLPPA